ncbi:MAG TPA: AAA family ATPase, partial [Myxococcota bacterium]|nr:AAA family ATPase [Myxococcota bacterium]
PGLLLIRGARQYGKSTWLEEKIAATIIEFGPGSSLYLNGDAIASAEVLTQQIRVLAQMFEKKARRKRLFIDEITAIVGWEKALKLVIDAGELRDVLVVTTGSKATDLRRGSERLPGRKGRLKRSSYIFTPISYAEFAKNCLPILGKQTLAAYVLSGGSPIACKELAETQMIPEYVTELTSDWVLGEITASGRTRSSLLSVLKTLYRFGTNPIGQSKLAREAGLANNTVAQGYIALLQDLLCVIPAYPIDTNKNQPIWRKQCKYHFINTLVATAWHPKAFRSAAELEGLEMEQGQMLEWIVAQELWRRQCIKGENPVPEELYFWESDKHELDFVLSQNQFIEVKRGAENPYNYAWFLKSHPKGHLTIINQATFETEHIRGITLENFLLEKF